MSDQSDPSPGQKLTYADRPEVHETFADFLERIMIDGSVMRLEFTVNRFDEPKSPGQMTGKRYTACRLVMPKTALLQVLQKLSQLASMLEQEGVVKRTETKAKPN